MGNFLGLKANAQLKEIAAYLNTPIATYTHSGNPEIVVSAVDVATDTFTSVAHGLSNGDILFPVTNYNAGNVFPIAIYAGGLLQTSGGYFVVNKTNDTFQLSLTSGGAAADIVANASMDLTKWHFEKIAPNGTITISNLPNLQRCKVKISGKVLQQSAGIYVLPNNTTASPEYMAPGTAAYINNNVTAVGDVWNEYECIIDTLKYFVQKFKGITVKSNNSTTNATALIDTKYVSPKYAGMMITSISFFRHTPANGYKIEVYRV